MPSLENERKKLDAATFSPTKTKPSKRIPNNLGDRALAIAAATLAMGYTLTDSQNIGAMQEKVEKRVSREFIKYMNGIAMANPKMYWHVYEPRKIGITGKRLFDLKNSDSTFKSVLRLQLTFRESKMMTPVPEELSTPGPTGKYVKRRHKYPNKAIVYEYGQTVKIRPKKAKALASLGRRRQSKNARMLPGGKYINFFKGTITIHTKTQETYGAMEQATQHFSQSVAPKIAQEVYGKQAKYMQEAGRLAIRKSITVKAPTQPQIKAMSKRIARSMARR